MSARTVVLSSATARTLVLVLGIALAVGTALAADYTVIRNPDGTYTTVPPEGLPVTPEQLPAEPKSGPPTFIDYTSVQAGNWNSSSTWTPSGIPGATDNVTINHNVTVDAASACANITIGAAGTLTCGSANTLTVNGNWANNGATSLTNGTVQFSGSTSTTLGGTNASTFYLFAVAKTDSLDTLLMNRAVTVSANTSTALRVDTGALVTNGNNLTCNGTSSRVVGTTKGRISVTVGGTVDIYYLYQWGLKYFTVSGSPTVNINRQDIANSGHRTDILGGTVNYTATGTTYNIQLYTNNSGWGWFATGGTVNFYGSVTCGNLNGHFRASGTSIIRFQGSDSSNVQFHGWSGAANNSWWFNDMRVEKTSGSLTFLTSNTSGCDSFVRFQTGITVNPGCRLNLNGTFASGRFFTAGAATNGGTLNMGSAVANTNHLSVAGAFANNGTFTLGPRVLTLGTASSSGSVTNGASSTFSAVGTGLTDTACITAVSETYPYAFTVPSGGTIASAYATWRWMNTSGVSIANGATVNPTNNFSYCSFYHGDISGPMLKLENAQVLVMNEVNFSGTAGYNIEKLGTAARDSVKGGIGNRWGESYDNDPSDYVYWEPPGDMGVTRILAPLDTVLLNTIVTPQAVVKNFGTVTKTFGVRFDIGTAYNDTQVVTSLAGGDSVTVNFRTCTLSTAGLFATKCSTRLRGDGNTANDKASGSVYVRAIVDAGVQAILVPVPGSTVDSGATVAPQVQVKNYGTQAASFTTSLRIPPYSANRIVVGLPRDSSRVVTGFTNWVPRVRGWNAMTCTLSLSGDMADSNNFKRESVFVAVRDVGVSKIIAPVGAITIGPVTPACSLRNTGNAYQPVKAYFQVEQGGTPVWLDSIALAGLPAGDTLVQFGSYTAVPGVFTTTWWTVMAGDIMPANDTLRGSFQTGSVDVEARTITAPNGNVDTAAAVTPAATVRNNGSFPATFSAWFFIDSAGTRIYTSTRTVTGLGSNATTPVTFDLLPKPHFLGTYATRCSVYIAFDGDPANDVVDDNFDFVAAPPIPPGWHELSQMPAPPSSRQVKDGGWLAEDGDIIYAAKGNKTADFYRYSTDTDSWQTLAPIPLGREAKVPGKGAVGVVDGDVYAVKGNNTQGFWRYVPDLDSWYQMADIPLGTTGKRVKGGSDIVSVKKPGQGGGSYLYLLKGGKNEFWRYDPEIDSWAAMPNAPIGLSGKDKYDKGSWLVDRRMPRQGPRVIYAHKAKYHEMFVYNTEGDSWLPGQLKGMPYIGRLGKSKKSKDGGCGASGGEGIYALKGGNTQELWEYYVEGDSWKELDPMPLMGSTGKNKNVKAGADIVKSGDYHYALKGNKTLELWQFVSPVIPLAPERRGREGVLAGVTTGTSPALRLAPNPLASGFATVAYTLPKPGMVQVRVSDATGRTVQTRTVVAGRSGTLSLNLRSLAAGVYLVRLDADGYSAQQKLVVQH